jgi:hypothetical protein
MKAVKIQAWVGMIAIFLVMRYYMQAFNDANLQGIIPLEFANPDDGMKILGSWQKTQSPRLGNVLEVGKLVTYYDFLFLLFYSTVLAFLSAGRRNREQSPVLKRLLHVNIFLAILAGLLDVAENLVLLHNMNHFQSGSYISAYWLAVPKFVLAGWVILVWLVSVVKGLFVRKP